ncbi:MAG: hypothetical protein LBL58_07345 [Tannerellaceae bacterium]|jgi:hypothetical protein|nr:hypothetical protein [Tannerellaceae bacterium]
MKRILFTLVLILPFVFNSCSNDDDDAPSLDGTTWECKFMDEGSQVEQTFEFTKDKVKFTFRETGYEENNTETGTYTYNPPKIFITIQNETVEGTVDGNKLILIGVENTEYIFIKK